MQNLVNDEKQCESLRNFTVGRKEKCLCRTASMESTIFDVQSTKTLGRRRNASRLVNTAFTTRTASPGSLLVILWRGGTEVLASVCERVYLMYVCIYVCASQDKPS